jgi:hypothetical protein
MLAIVWNPRGFHLIKVLDKGRKSNAGYYIAEILEPSSQSRSIETAGNERKLMVHADNAHPHITKLSTQYFNENQMKSAPHPPYSPDLTPSDFYLFGDAKRCLAGLSFKDADHLFAAIEGVLEGIENATLQTVFLEWMDRLRKCIATNGEYTEEAQINVIEERSFILLILRFSCPGGTPCRFVAPDQSGILPIPAFAQLVFSRSVPIPPALLRDSVKRMRSIFRRLLMSRKQSIDGCCSKFVNSNHRLSLLLN